MNLLIKIIKESLNLKFIFLFFNLIAIAQVDKKSELFKTLKSQDSIIFERAFNKCEVEKLELIIAENIEFYHDINGVQNKEEFINTIKNNLCEKPGTFSRKLIESSLEVHQLKSKDKTYGAIQKGSHDFYRNINNIKEKTGSAQFIHLWILDHNKWKLKRVLSFDHKNVTE